MACSLRRARLEYFSLYLFGDDGTVAGGMARSQTVDNGCLRLGRREWSFFDEYFVVYRHPTRPRLRCLDVKSYPLRGFKLKRI